MLPQTVPNGIPTAELPRKISFALGNAGLRYIKRGNGVLVALSIDAIDPYISSGPSPIGGIGFTGDPNKFPGIHSRLLQGLPMEPVHIFRLRARPGSEEERQIFSIDTVPERVEFEDGRHRYALLRFHRRRVIFACVPERDADWFRQFAPPNNGPDSDCELVTNPNASSDLI